MCIYTIGISRYYVNTHTHTQLHTLKRVCTHIRMHTHTIMNAHVYAHTHTDERTRVYMYVTGAGAATWSDWAMRIMAGEV